MSRGLTEEPEEQKTQPENIDLMEMIYALGLYLQDIEKKLDSLHEKVEQCQER
jgi:hypothetical protein